MKGIVFDIQRLSIHDGPGIRTTVFLKGCPLHCLWCHNPESQSAVPVLAFWENLCIGCGTCLEVCPNHCHRIEEGKHFIDRDHCEHCGICVQNCTGALKIYGKFMETDAVMEKVLRDRSFYDNSGGGVTVSGGEPMAQADFTVELLRKLKSEGIHTCVETGGYTKIDHLIAAAPYTDLFLYDYKVSDSRTHEICTGVGNERILQNLLELDRRGNRIILRCPVIPGINDNEDHFSGIARVADSLKNIEMVHVEPYNRFGAGKAVSIGMKYLLPDTEVPAEDTVQRWVSQIQNKTRVPVIKS